MKKTQAIVSAIFFISLIWPTLIRGQRNNWDLDYGPFERDDFGIRFQSGATNTPLLAMDWFLIHPGKENQSCQVSRSGDIFSVCCVPGSGAAQLNETNLALLIETMNALPLPPKIAPPLERSLVVRGIRSNHWFRCVYDRAEIPAEVEKLFEITGVYVEWFIPQTDGRNIVHSEFGGYHNLQAQIHSFRLSLSTPNAVSSGHNGVQIWNLKQGTVQDVLSDGTLPFYRDVNIVSAMSSDGKLLAMASSQSVIGLDWKSKRTLWSRGALEHNSSNATKHLVIGGDRGQFLFAAGAHTLERWDLGTGNTLGLLVSNQAPITFLDASRDGRIVVAGFGVRGSPGLSLRVWEAEKNQPAAQFEAPFGNNAAISPNGQKIVLSRFGQKHLVLWDWLKGTTNQVPLRLPYGINDVISMYWSPDETRFAVEVNDEPFTTIIYNTATWEPLAKWTAKTLLAPQKFVFDNDGNLFRLCDHDLDCLDATTLKHLGE